MLNQQTLEKLYAMKLDAMADAFKEQIQRIRIDCVRNEPQSYPLVGQARLVSRVFIYKQISFFECKAVFVRFGRVLFLGRAKALDFKEAKKNWVYIMKMVHSPVIERMAGFRRPSILSWFLGGSSESHDLHERVALGALKDRPEPWCTCFNQHL